MAKKRVAAYCRVSTKSDDQENSFENQKSYFEREYQNNPDYTLYDIYADKGITGTTLQKRPDFNRMLTDTGLDIENGYKIIAKPKFDLIVTKNTSRFARNMSVDIILKALEQNHVYVYFLDLNLSTEKPENITLIQVIFSIDERESRDKSKKVLFGLEESIKKGNIHTNGRLFGYKYYPRPENRLEIIEREAEVVRLIFDLYANKGMGFYRIGNYLKQNNIQTRNGKDFSGRGLRLMITNEAYTGRGVRKKYTEGYVFNKHNRRETGNAVIFDTDKIPAIIDMQTFEKAQEILHSRLQHEVQKGKYNGKTIYTGKLICGCCGETYIASNGDYLAQYGRRVRNYACRSKRKIAYDKNGERIMLCNNPNVYETKLDELVSVKHFAQTAIEILVLNVKLLQELTVSMRVHLEKEEDRLALQEAQKQLRGILEKKGRLLDLYTDGSFGKEELDAKVAPLAEIEKELRNTIAVLSKSKEDLNRDIKDVESTIIELNRKIGKYKHMMKTGGEITREEILENIEYIKVMPDRELTVKYKIYDEVKRIVAWHSYIMPKGLKELYEDFC